MKMKEQVRMGFKWLAMGLMAWVTSVGAQTPVLNELMASNDLAHYDDFFEFDDWVELYNPGGLLQLAGYHLSDNPSNLTKYTIPDTDPGTTFLTPGDHMVIWLDKDSAQGVLHANFKLSSENEGLWFTAPDGVTVLDSIVYPPQQTDISYGRACDGCEMWEYFNVPTPEATNAQTQIPTPFLYINEVLLENTGALVDESFEAEPWLEIYNPNANQVNLGGYTVAVQGGASYTLPLDNPVETTIEGEGFLLLWMDGEPEEGGHHLDFVPAIENQTIWLIGQDMVVADEYQVQASFANVSYGRQFDGSANSVFFDIPTPRVTNSLVVIPPAALVINECLTFNTSGLVDEVGELEDWVEIHNPTSAPVDLSGYYVTDRLNNPTKWRIPVDAADGTPSERFVGHFTRGLDLFLPAEDEVMEMHLSVAVDEKQRYSARGLSLQPTRVKRFLERINLSYDARRPTPLQTRLSSGDRIELGDDGTEVEFIMLPKEER